MVKGLVTGCIAALLVLIAHPLHAQGIFEGLFDKAKKSAEQKSRDRLNQRIVPVVEQRDNALHPSLSSNELR